MGDGVSEKDSLRRGRSRSQSFEGKSRSRSASVEKDFDPLKTELTRDEFVAYVENPRKQPARGISYTEALAAPPEVATPVREALDKARHKHRFDDPKKRVFSQASAQKLNELANIDDALEFDFTNQAELHNIDKARLAHELRSDLDRGLPAELAAEKLAEDGPNELEKPPRVTFFVLFLIQLSQIITLLLIAACVASACVNATDSNRRGSALSYVDSIAIFIIVFLNAYIAAASENAANGALEALDALSSPVSVAVRDGEEVELDSTLKCFIPDYIPAVGEMDAFIKVPRPDGERDELGLQVLDEPAAAQSDATVLELQLRAVSKKQHGDVAIRSIEHAAKNPLEIERWIKSIEDLHRSKPPPQVNYRKAMPDIDKLMEEWPSEFEDMLRGVALPTADLECSLPELARIACSIMDLSLIHISEPTRPRLI